MSLEKANAFLQKYVVREGLNIIQIGTNNGGDHVLDFILKNESKIKNFLAIDAFPKCTENIRKGYSFLGERLIALNVAIGTKDGYSDFFYLDEERSSLASLNKGQMPLGDQKLLKKITIPILNINTLLNNLTFQGVDRLYIDIEGMDAIVLLEMDFEKYSPPYIQFEFTHSDGYHSVSENFKKIEKKLKKYKYKLRKGRMDIIAQKIN